MQPEVEIDPHGLQKSPRFRRWSVYLTLRRLFSLTMLIPLAFDFRTVTITPMSLVTSISSSSLAALLGGLWQSLDFSEAIKQPAVQSALIAAAIGLVVFAGTQWVLHCRDRTSLLLEKLENLYKAISALGNLGVKRLDYFAGPESHEELLKVRGGELTDEIAMLQAFHFPPLAIRVEIIMRLNGEALKLLGGSTRASNRESVRTAISELNIGIAETLGIICKNKGRYTRARLRDYIPFVRSLVV